jgi:type VI secretion system protein ImpL
MGARELAGELAAVLERDALSRLARLDEVFDTAQVYVPHAAGFRHWQGGKGAMADAFGTGDAAGLTAYLAQQQEFIDTIVQQAEAVLAELPDSALNRQQLVARWRALATDLRRYRLKSPASSRMALETFIAVGSADIDLANCADKLAPRQPQPRGADLFAERLQSLRIGMLARCRELAGGDDQLQWQQFAEAYNRDMGKRAPFAAPSTGGNGGAGAALDTVPADGEAVGAVMKLYDRARAASALAERDPAQPGARPAVRKADLLLRRVRALMAPLYPADEGQTGGLDVAVEFRANTGAEAGANQIMDWALTIGDASLRLADRAHALRWEPGMPVVLSLRLAHDGGARPGAQSGRPDMSVADRTVSFRFDDPWALFSFINAYRDGDPPGDDGRAPLLRFEFPLLSTAAPPACRRSRRGRACSCACG